MTAPNPLAINVNTPAHTDLLADTDLYLKTAAQEIDAVLAGGYQYGFFSGTAKVYDNSGTFGVTIPGLKTIQGAVGTMVSTGAGNSGVAPCLFTIASYNAGGDGTVYGQVWNWPYQASVYVPQPPLIDKLMHQAQPMWPTPINTTVRVCIIAWGTV